MPALRHAYWARILGRHNGKQYCHYACPVCVPSMCAQFVY